LVDDVPYGDFGAWVGGHSVSMVCQVFVVRFGSSYGILVVFWVLGGLIVWISRWFGMVKIV